LWIAEALQALLWQEGIAKAACIPAHYSFHPFSSTRQLPYN
jgi:hypothetical protein